MFRTTALALGLLLSPFLSGQEKEAAAVHLLLDNWHRAAAVADEKAFFGAMTRDCIYLGTELGERWKRDELKNWSVKFFDRESAWNFRPYDRQIYFAGDSSTAWFEEKLETWMGPCRGSGVVTKTDKGWFIAHYNLAVTVPNILIQDFIKLTQGSQQKEQE